MKLSIVVLACVSVAAFGCANATTQAKLDAANAKNAELSSRLELTEGRVQEVRSDAAKNEALCARALGKIDAMVDATKDFYHKEEPKVEQKAIELYNETKPVVVQKANEAVDWVVQHTTSPQKK